MKFDLYKPCSDCPFLRKGGIRLTLPRVREIAGVMLDSQGSTFVFSLPLADETAVRERAA